MEMEMATGEGNEVEARAAKTAWIKSKRMTLQAAKEMLAVAQENYEVLQMRVDGNRFMTAMREKAQKGLKKKVADAELSLAVALAGEAEAEALLMDCLLYTSPSPRDS